MAPNMPPRFRSRLSSSSPLAQWVAIASAAVWLTGCPNTGTNGIGDSKNDLGSGNGEDASGETRLDGGGQGKDGGSDAARPDGAGLTPDAAAVPPDGAVLTPDATLADCKAGDTRICPDCPAGHQACVEGSWGPCTGSAETCNGADDNCDGRVDEDFPELGTLCSNGLGECQVDGMTICTPDGGGVMCGATAAPPSAEICDGFDNDCDGIVDVGPDGQPLGEPCYEGPPGTAGIGACHAGAALCDARGLPGACQGQGLPTDELCDGIDNDCDGLVDEGPDGGTLVTSCYDGPEGTDGIGPCHGGQRRCADGVVGTCEGEVVPGAEICDSLDNDCDGTIDNPPPVNDVPQSCDCQPGEVRNCYGGPEGTDAVGPCHAGHQTCLPDGSSWGICDGQVVPAAEICDGLDNDCSGVTDDNVPGAGAACGGGVGACASVGRLVCNPRLFELACDAVPTLPSDELCDGLDNNCDGRVDEDFGVGDVCALGLGACEGVGALACDGSGGVHCVVVSGDPTAEVCDGIDNDCDGTIDNGMPLNEPCSLGLGTCAADGVTVCDAQGGVTCGAVAGQPAAELCDGLDNDCDGVVDNAPTDVGQPCQTGLAGVCADGIVVCVEGGLSCAANVQASDEICDGLDNDCDGTTDEAADGALLTQACYEGPAGTSGVGPCADGLRQCQGGRFGACERQVVPQAEVCDQIDNNCDGAVDNLAVGECACEPGSASACYGGAPGTENVGACHGGQWTCSGDGLSFGPCVGEQQPAAEICDGRDNDCNGRADDNVPGAGGACSAGIGQCLVQGQFVCDPAAGRVVCDAVAGPARAEICDNIDNDCDGQVDDGLGLGAVCTVGTGACVRSGRIVCDGRGGVTCSAQAGAPSAEICDNIDNDCDGAVDNGLGLGTACTAGIGACLAQGQKICGAAGAVVCSAVPRQPQAEICDGIDNNCNGASDEGDPGSGAACNTGAQGICSAGVLHCQNAGLRCVQTLQPVAETCDGLDNNCNGVVDDSAVGGPLSQACYTGPAGTSGRGICHGGTQTCQNGGYGACAGQVVPAPTDICDGLDNNCNGTVDEQPAGQMCACAPGTVRACYSGAAGTQGVGLCRAGTQTCSADGLAWGACQGEVLPAAETCDARDNDCNGSVDDAPGVGAVCAVGVGDCLARGVNRCNLVTHAVECGASAGAPTAEVCDGRDNNCNGTIDDVAGLGAACTNGTGACQRGGAQVCDLANQRLVCNAVAGVPVAESCDGIDNDCNGVVDDGRLPGVGAACSAGQGDCVRAGTMTCNGAAGVLCNAVAGLPTPEICDSRDNNCNGAIDDNPTDVGQRCVLGVGACRGSGVTLCDGRLFCNAQVGLPTTEICDGIDNNCDGTLDEGLDCNVYKSCLDGYVRGGARSNGIYRLQPAVGGATSNVYCDMTTDNGGWTLVGSSATAVPDDQQSGYYADLMTLAPAGANAGLWDGLRPLADRFDLRFACRASLGAANAPMDVDLSFYRNAWYTELTAGPDASTCFSEDSFQDFPAPARRNNVNGMYRPRGDQWDWGMMEGEDFCGDTGDFTVDFDDRGMDSNQGDGTDWGEDDGQLKCGANGLATGQWFVFARERRRVAVVGPPLAPTLTAAGFDAETVPLDANLAAKLNPDVYETLLLGRYSFAWPSMTAAVLSGLRAFSNQGGNVVTEYDGAGIFGASFNANYGYVVGAPRPLNMFRFDTNGGNALASNTPINIIAPTDGMVAGLPNPLQLGGGSELFTTLGPVQGLSTFLSVVGTFTGNGTAQFPRGVWPALARGRRCGGNFLTANFDYSDAPMAAEAVTLVKNLVSESFLPPPAGLEDTCRQTQRPNLMLCGSSGRALPTLIRGGQTLTVVNGCAPDNDTQALLITRDGNAQIAAITLQNYLNAGGIVLTEYNNSADIYNKVFGGAVALSAVRSGDCSDNVQPMVQFNPREGLWDENRFEPVAAGTTGCGYDMAAYPGIVPLGGTGGAVVNLAYKDYLARGRVWFIESDWQDGALAFTAQSAGLMHYMILHGAGGPLNFGGPSLVRSVSQAQAQGFSTCYVGPYNGVVPVANIQAACTKGVLMMGCRAARGDALTVSAMANWGDVFTDVGDARPSSHVANGAEWYYSANASIGFAPQGLGVDRSSCDTLATSPEQRMCWHTAANSLEGGYRCGSNLELNASAAWERVVLQRQGTLP